jgi:hypothetical protein
MRPRATFIAVLLLPPIATGFLPAGSVRAQSDKIPLPDLPLTSRELRRQSLGTGIIPPGAATTRIDRLLLLRASGTLTPWLTRLVGQWLPPEGLTPARLHAEAGLRYAPALSEDGFRDLTTPEECPLLVVRGAAAGRIWQVVVEAEAGRKWQFEHPEPWNIPGNPEELDPRVFRRASLGVTIGPFLVEMGRLGRDWRTGRSGGLLLGGEVRFFDGLAVEASGSTWSFESLYAPLDPVLTVSERAEIPTEGRFAFTGEEKAVYLHRLTWRPRESLRLGLSEGAIFFGRRPTLGDLTPILPVHDRYQDFDNTMTGLDLLWYPRPGLGVYFELAADDLRAATEPKGSSASAVGLLAGMETLRGPWEAFAEIVATQPGFYRHIHPLARWESRLRYSTRSRADPDDFDQPLGHPLGPDATGFYSGWWWTLPIRGTASGSGDRGIVPPPPARIGLLMSYRRHRSLQSDAVGSPRPVDLGSPDAPAVARAVVTVISLGFEWPLHTLGAIEGALSTVRTERTALPGSPGMEEAGVQRGTGGYLGLRIPIR